MICVWIVGLVVFRILRVSRVVFLVLVILIVVVVIGILVGICMIESREFILFRVLVCFGILIMGSGVLVVIIFGRWVVFLV